MDDYLIRILRINQDLPIGIKNIIIETFENHLNKQADHIGTGEFRYLLDRIIILYNEIKSISLSKKVYQSLIYNLASRYLEKSSLSDHNAILVKEILFNQEICNQILALPTNNSGFVSYVKEVGPKVIEFFKAMENKVSLSVLKTYNELIEICNLQGISPHLNDHELKVELEKRYGMFHEYNTKGLKYYKNEIQKKEYTSHKDQFAPENLVYIKSTCNEGIVLQKELHQQLLEYHQKNHCVTRPLNKNINLYYLDNLLIVAYKYDDIPNMALTSGKIMLKWSDKEFWEVIFDSKINFVTHDDFHYFIENGEFSEFFKVTSLEFNKEKYRHLCPNGTEVIFVPEKYLEEALYKHLKMDRKDLDFITLEKLLKIGIQPEKLTDNLLTGDNIFYFKNPEKIMDLLLEKTQDENAKTINGQISKITAYSLNYLRSESEKDMTGVSSKNYYYRKTLTRKPKNLQIPYID